MQWRGSVVDPDDPEPETWTPVEVPGRPEAFAGAEAVAYRTTFEDPRSGAESHAVLELRGLYGEATVKCNGEIIATHDTYFLPLRVRLDEHLEDENELRVVCRRPTDGFGGVYETDLVPETAAVPGIWWAVRLRTYPGTYIDRLTARPALDGEEGTVRVGATVVADADLDDRLTLSIRPEGSRRGRGMMERVPVEAAAGERVSVEHAVTVRDPALWWPADLGEQHRYVLRAKLGSVERTVTTGFCAVDRDGETLSVNGTETTARGVNLIDATPEDVDRVRDLNVNLVRAHAHVPPRGVVDACVEHGVLLWQDLPLTGERTVDVDRGREIAAALDRHHGATPALAAITVHDDPVAGLDAPVGSGLLDRLRFRWRTWRSGFDDSTARAIAESVSASIPSLPVVGPPWIDPDAATFYPGWAYGDVDGIDAVYGRLGEPSVVAEFGAGVADEDATPFDRAAAESRAGDDRDAALAYQARVCKRTAEYLRREGVPVMAAFRLRGGAMGLLEPEGAERPAAAALATAYEPVQATLADPDGTESVVVVHNDTDSRIAGTLSWETPEDSGGTEVAVGANARATVATIALPTAGTVGLSLSFDGTTVENEYHL